MNIPDKAFGNDPYYHSELPIQEDNKGKFAKAFEKIFDSQGEIEPESKSKVMEIPGFYRGKPVPYTANSGIPVPRRPGSEEQYVRNFTEKVVVIAEKMEKDREISFTVLYTHLACAGTTLPKVQNALQAAAMIVKTQVNEEIAKKDKSSQPKESNPEEENAWAKERLMKWFKEFM